MCFNLYYMFINVVIFSRTRYVGEAFTIKKSVVIFIINVVYVLVCVCSCTAVNWTHHTISTIHILY